MQLLIAKGSPQVRGSIGESAVETIKTIVPTSLSLIRNKVNNGLIDIWLDFEEFEGSNCVMLFSMWYDLDSGVFSISRSDTVTGIKLFTIEDLFGSFGFDVPKNISDKVLEYKATGKIDNLFSGESSESFNTFLSYFLSDSKPKKSTDEILKTLENLVDAVSQLEFNLRFLTRNQGKDLNSKAFNIFSTTPSYVRVTGEPFDEKELYASSCRRNLSRKSSSGILKATQAFEIAEAESVRSSDGYLDPVIISVENTPTFKRISGREKSSIKTSVERNNTIRDSLSQEETGSDTKDIIMFRRFFVEVSKCAKKILEV